MCPADNVDTALEASLTSARAGGRLSSHTGLPSGGSPVNGNAGGSSVNNLGVYQRFDEDVKLPLIKVVVLGAPGVGKTSVVKRFVTNEFCIEHRKTKKKSEHFPSLILNDSLFELKLIDLPVIPFFPPDSMVEWSDYRFFGLRSASAYLLVYDVSVPSTFSFVKALREQMYEYRDMANIPVIVVANKMDLVASIAASNNTKNNSSHHHPLISERCGSSTNNYLDRGAGHLTINLSQPHHNGITSTSAAVAATPATATMVAGAASSAASMYQHGHTGQQMLEVHQYDRKEISHIVRKNWKSIHVECSAKYNWNIVTIFRELAITLDMVANGQTIGSNTSVRKRRCLVF